MRSLFTLLPALFCATAMAQTLPSAAIQQIQSLVNEKQDRSASQKKLDSQLHYAYKMGLGQGIAAGVPYLALPNNAKPNVQGMYLVDITWDGTPALLNEIRAEGGQVVNSFPQYKQLRAQLPLLSLDSIAARGDVKFIRAADQMRVNPSAAASAQVLAARRAANLRSQLSKALPALAAKRRLSGRIGLAFARPIEAAGDVAHQANLVRSQFGFDGTGIKVGVLSDGVDQLAAMQTAGNLPAVTVLPGQAGSGAEGTAMLAIIYDLAPGAQLYFATANPSQAQFAANIVALRTAGCDIIVDDVTYFAEGVFQDGVIAQAVSTVTTAGAMYFSSAANSGNLTDGTSGTWEGDFTPSGASILGVDPLVIHNFGGTNGAALITAATGPITLKWSDPLGASCNDYDLFVFDNTFATLLTASTNLQSCTQDPYEFVDVQAVGSQIIVAKSAAAAVRALHLDTNRGRIQGGTSGNTFGHNAASTAVTVAAVDVHTAGGGVFIGGASNPVETYSSDGPRRMFYDAAGNPLTPGNFLFGTNGGVVVQKVDLAAADCGASAVTGFNPFCGTSAAAPHAAAIAALVKSGLPSLTATQVRTALNTSALDIMALGLDRDSGLGIVMALPAVMSLTTPVTFQSSPSGLNFTVTNNGCSAGSYTTPKTLPWFTGVSCTGGLPTPQVTAPGTRYVFSAWGDSSTINPRTGITPVIPTTYTANFTAQYLLTTVANPIAGGTVTGGGWYDTGGTATVTATPNAPFVFTGFTGGITSTINPSNVTMSSAKTVTATFNVPTTMVVSAAAGQYSDPVTLQATISPFTAGGLAVQGTVQFAVNGINTLAVAPVSPSTGIATLVYYIAPGQGTYNIAATFIPAAGSPYLGSNGTALLNVTLENAVVQPSATNPSVIKLTVPGTTTGPVTLAAAITEVRDAGPGDISKAVPVTCALNPISSGNSYRAFATTSGGGPGGTLTASCVFPSVGVNSYHVVYTVGGNYYTGTAQTTLTVAPYTK